MEMHALQYLDINFAMLTSCLQLTQHIKCMNTQTAVCGVGERRQLETRQFTIVVNFHT